MTPRQTTAGLSVIIVCMLLIDVLLLGQLGVLLVWFILIVLTLPVRKAIAICLDYYFEHRSQESYINPTGSISTVSRTVEVLVPISAIARRIAACSSMPAGSFAFALLTIMCHRY